MSRFSDKDFEVAILAILSGHGSGRVVPPGEMTPTNPFSNFAKAHKMNMLGRGGFQSGDIEYRLHVQFTADERAQAARVFDDLKRSGYITPTYDDLVDPENWVTITESGREYLRMGAADYIDTCLAKISPHLVELRKGMWDAVRRTSPDAARHAAHSARELIGQLLKEGAPADLKTRKERFTYLMQQQSGEVSGSDLDIIDASWKLIEAEHSKVTGESHARRPANGAVVRGSVEAAERILALIFPESE